MGLSSNLTASVTAGVKGVSASVGASVGGVSSSLIGGVVDAASRATNGDHVMRGRDVFNSNLGAMYVRIDGKMRRVFELKEISAELENVKEEIMLINDVMTKHKVVACKGTGSFTIYTGVPEYAQILRKFIDQHINTYFEVTFQMLDPESSHGPRIVTLRDVCVDKTVLGHLNVENGILDEQMDITFDDYYISEDFVSWM